MGRLEKATSSSVDFTELPTLTDRLLQVQFFCAVTLVIGFSFSLAAATFTDANWISMGGIPGANGPVYAVTVDASGRLWRPWLYRVALCTLVGISPLPGSARLQILPGGTGPIGPHWMAG